MANITAADVKKFRDLTGAGMMDAKRALTEAGGDVDAAIEILRVKTKAKVQTRGAERSAAAGLVASQDGALVELNSETDFVAKSDDFRRLGADVAAVAAETQAADVVMLGGAALPDGRTVNEAIDALAAVIGEKLQLGRVAYFGGSSMVYLHRRASDLPPTVGVLVEYEGDDADVARATAMQIAAMRPEYLTREDVPDEVVAKEREIAEATAREEGKPEPALPKIIEGRLNGYFKEHVLLEQASVQDHKRTVKAQLDEAGVRVRRFARFEVGKP
jgi:elongation factor Ts